MEVQTLALLLAKSLQEIFTNGHLVEVHVVREQTLFVLTRVFEELLTDNDVARIVNIQATTVCVGQALTKAPVDRTNAVGL